MKRVSWVVVCAALGMSAVGACSGDGEFNGSAGSSGASGAAARDAEGEGGLAGTGGTPADSSGTGGAGTGGAAGVDAGPTGCLACLEQSTACDAPTTLCESDDRCRQWLTCIQSCNNASTNACSADCDAQFEDVALLYGDVYACICSSCNDDPSCSGLNACDSHCTDSAALAPTATPPPTLSQTGLYVGSSIAPYAKPYQPAFVLWSDGAVKARYAYIPKCSKIDTSDPDHWDIPVGSRFWKEFTRDGVRIETRMIHRFGPGEADWIFAAYHWDNTTGNEDAVLVPEGVQNANGTPHDIPNEAQCKNCHTRLTERILSFSAIQLSHSLGGETMATLSAEGRLTVPKPEGFTIPGNDTARKALGYLHANCGNCHNSAETTVGMRLRVLTNQTTVETTDTYLTAVRVPTTVFNCLGLGIGVCQRIAPGLPAESAIIMRMSSRTSGVQMPPLATELTDQAGIDAVTAWIGTVN
jgi:hypothetical protein